MSLVSWLRGFWRRSIENPAVPLSQGADYDWLLDAFGARPNVTGQAINPRTAARNVSVYGAVRIIAETAASLPVGVVRVVGPNEWEPAPDHELTGVLAQPNELQTGQGFRETQFLHHLLWGNAYAETLRAPADGRVTGRWALNPDVTRPVLRERRLWYETYDDRGRRRLLAADEVTHVALWQDIATGRGAAPVAAGQTAIGLALAAETHGARFFAEGQMPPGAIEMPGRVNAQLREEIKKIYRESRKNRSSELVFIAGGAKFVPFNVDHDSAQFLETRRFQVLEIARMYGVPPHMLCEAERGAPKSSVEAQEREFANHTLGPLTHRFAAEETRRLMLPRDRGLYAVHYDLSNLVRADTRTTWQTYSIGRQMGIYSVNEIRRKEGLPGIGPRGDQYMSPVNLDVLRTGALLEVELRRAAAELEAAERRALLEGSAEGADGLAERAQRFYADWRGRIAERLSGIGQRLAASTDAERWAAWADQTARRHCERARAALEQDPARWIAAGYLDYDLPAALAALEIGHGQENGNGNGRASAA